MPTPPDVLQLIRSLLARMNKPVDDLGDEVGLYGGGLGLDSLETAELSAMLEDAYGADPFSEGGALPQTVGEVLAFYSGAGISGHD